MARPQKQLDQTQFEGLCALQCTLEEIAGFFHCSEDTVERWCKRTYNENFAETYKKHSAKGKMSLRRAQFRLAEKSAAMAIFLGKNYLGQSDRQEIVATTNGQLANLIDGLKEPCDDLYTETAGIDGVMED